MTVATLYELIGYVGSALVVLSLTMRSVLRLRVINLVGAAVFAVYGVLIGATPVWVVNGLIVLIDVHHLARMLRPDEEYYTVLEVDLGSSYLQRFLEFHAEDITRFQPEFQELHGAHRALFVLRDMVPAGLVLFRAEGTDAVAIDLDYAIPGYRDLRVGQWVYRQGGVLAGEGFRTALAAPGNEDHRRYLERVGFEPAEGRFVRAL